MKFVAKVLVAVLFCAPPWLALCAEAPVARRAQPPAPRVNVDASVRAAIALANARRPVAPPVAPPAKPAPKPAVKRGCGCGPDCQCEPGACDCVPDGRCSIDCPCGKKALSLNAAIEKAVAEDRPLLIWVRQVCVPCQANLPDCLHVHVTEYQGVSDLVSDCAVIVGEPDGRGGMTRVATIPGCPDDLTARVRSALSPPRPVFFAPPPPPMFFGGCAGGG